MSKTFKVILILLSIAVLVFAGKAVLDGLKSENEQAKGLLSDIETLDETPTKVVRCNIYYDAIEVQEYERIVKIFNTTIAVPITDKYTVPTIVEAYGKRMTPYDSLLSRHKLLYPVSRVDTLLNIRRPLEECELITIPR